jgi:hypothetical protein
MQNPEERPTAQHLAKTLREAAHVLSYAEQTSKDAQKVDAKNEQNASAPMTDDELEDMLLKDDPFQMPQPHLLHPNGELAALCSA